MYSPNMTRVVASRRMSRLGNLKERDFFGDPDEDGRIILNSI
jgi:hypothetical protein